MFHHVSRHLSDRDKVFPIAWNIVGARALRRIDVAGVTIDTYGGAGFVAGHSNVDYSWTADLDLAIRRAITSRIGVFAHGHGEMFGVDGTGSRGTQTGGRVEAGRALQRSRGGARAVCRASSAESTPIRSTFWRSDGESRGFDWSADKG